MPAQRLGSELLGRHPPAAVDALPAVEANQRDLVRTQRAPVGADEATWTWTRKGVSKMKPWTLTRSGRLRSK